jgi:hypothetical protein
MDMTIPITPEEKGYIGRECPKCERYFKVRFGTGSKEDIPCHCPYCNYIGSHNEFFTKEQIEYAKSVGLHKITKDFLKELIKYEIQPKPNEFISIGIKVKGKPTPIYYYSEKKCLRTAPQGRGTQQQQVTAVLFSFYGSPPKVELILTTLPLNQYSL